jgi:hypothetical protein
VNVRWDAVVDRSLVAVDPVCAPARRAAPGPARIIPAHVELFGALVTAGARRSFDLELPAGAAVGDVLAALAGDLGEAFLARVLDPAGRKRSYCRLFVDGVAVEDLQQPLDTASAAAQIEIVLLMGLEGG